MTESLRLNPRYADAHNNLGNVLNSQGKYEAAAAHFNEAVRLDPGFAEAHSNLAMMLFHQKRYAEAKAQFTERCGSIPATPIFTTAWGRSSRGRRDMRRRRLISPRRRGQSRLGRGTLQPRPRPRRTGEVRDSGGSLCRGHSTGQPGYVAAHQNLGNVLYRLGNYEAAAAHYAEAIRLDPGYVEAYNASACSWRPVPTRSSATARGRSRSRPAPASWRSGKSRAFLIRWPRRMPRPALQRGGQVAEEGDRTNDG